MKNHKLLYIVTFVCLLCTLKMCTNVDNTELDLLLSQKDNEDKETKIQQLTHTNYIQRKEYDSLNKLYQKAIYIKPIVKKPYINHIIKDTIVDNTIIPIVEIKDSL